MKKIHDALAAGWQSASMTPGGRHGEAVPIEPSLEHASPHAAGPVDVLIADRTRDVVELVAHALASAGLCFVAAHDAASALVALLVQRPRVMVIDTVGLGTLGWLRAASQNTAISRTLSLCCSLDWETCRMAIDKHVPGGVARAMTNADNWFSGYVPALTAWQFGHDQVEAVSQPVLSVIGAKSERWFVDRHELLRVPRSPSNGSRCTSRLARRHSSFSHSSARPTTRRTRTAAYAFN